MTGDAHRIGPALGSLRRVAGVPVAFGGLVNASGVRLTELAGTVTDSLRGLMVTTGHGLGGKALALGLPVAVSDYAAARTISHEYDGAVAAEGLRSVLAVPVVVNRSVRAVMYGATRQPLPFGDRVLAAAVAAVRDLEQEIAAREEARRLLSALQRAAARIAAPRPDWEEVRALHAELVVLTRRVSDRELRSELAGIASRLARATRPLSAGSPVSPGPSGSAVSPVSPLSPLSPRELDVLTCVALGATNADAARQLGLRPETVKGYLRGAMRKLGAHTRTQAVIAARRAGLLP